MRDQVCIICGAIIPRKDNELPARYQLRKVCWQPGTTCKGKSQSRNAQQWKKANPEQYAKKNSRRAAERAQVKKDSAFIQEWKPKPRKILLSDAEQLRINRAIDNKHRFDLAPGRSLSPAEIAAISGEITHISAIPFTMNNEALGNREWWL